MSYCIRCCSSIESTSLSCPSCQAGLRYGNYQVIRPLSEQPDYCLYEVRDLENNFGVMKVLRNGRAREQLDQEKEILQSLMSPGIPTFYGRFTVLPGLDCLVWSYSGGRNLEEILAQERPIPQLQALEWMRQLAQILQEVHEHNYKHLDIRPSNIIHKPDDQLVLQNFNPSGEVRCPGYTPREQATSETAVVQSDFFALGRTFIHLLTGRDLSDLEEDSSHRGRLLWRDGAPQISEPFADLIDEMVAPNMQDRPQTAQVILERINNISSVETEPMQSSEEQSAQIDAMVTSDVEIQPQTNQVSIEGTNSLTTNSTESVSSSDEQSNPIDAVVIPNVETQSETPQINLEEINQPTTPDPFGVMRLIILGMIAGALSILVFLGSKLVSNWWPATSSEPPPNLACDYKIGDDFSCGEESPFEASQNLTPEKISGIVAFRNKKYKQAIDKFTQAREKDLADPETLIYLNNARLEAKLQANKITNDKILTIPVVVPIVSVEPSLPEAILRGVAQYQDKFNKGSRNLRVIIVDDHGRPEKAKSILERLVENSEILGVVGPYASEVSQKSLEASLDILTIKRLAIISYGSTSQKLSCLRDNPSCKENFFFRPVPTTQVTALALAKYLNNHGDNKNQHVAIFYNKNSLFSQNLTENFKSSLGKEKVALEEDVCTTRFDVESILNQMEQKKVSAIALFPDGGICGSSHPNIIHLINAINAKRESDEQRRSSGKKPLLLGSWAVLGADTLNDDGFMREAMNNSVMFSPWDPWTGENSESKDFLKNANKLWLSKEDAKMLRETAIFENGIITGVTATTYDAMQALVTAIKKSSRPTREQVRKTLASPDFKAEGVTGKIGFNGSDRREEIGGLVTVIPSCSNLKKYYIVPLKPEQLKCLPP